MREAGWAGPAVSTYYGRLYSLRPSLLTTAVSTHYGRLYSLQPSLLTTAVSTHYGRLYLLRPSLLITAISTYYGRLAFGGAEPRAGLALDAQQRGLAQRHAPRVGGRTEAAVAIEDLGHLRCMERCT